MKGTTSMVRRRAFLLTALVLVVLVGGRNFGNAPVDSRNSQTVTVEIREGMGARAIARQLKEAGLLRSPLGFVARVVLTGKRGSLRAGRYAFSPRETGAAMLERLVRGETLPEDVSVTFPEGFTLKQIAARLEAKAITDADAFRGAALADRFRHEFDVLQNAPADATLEGYLFPDTYRLKRGTAAEDVIRRMLRRFAEQYEAAVSEVAQEEAQGQGGARPPAATSVHAIVTMASIIEREVVTPDDRRLVAGILWKRDAAGMGLDADATIRYALNKWDGRLTVEDLRADSRYNTRRYRGLPPGPIGNPGRGSLQAALEPQPSEFLYYLSASDNQRTIFSKTLEEHSVAKRQHLPRGEFSR